MKKYLIACLVGAVLGVIGARFLFVNSGLSLIPWAIASLAFGYFATNMRQALGIGATFGFALAYTFMLVGYGGSEPIITRLAPFILLGIIGAICGLILAVIGYFIGKKLRKPNPQN